ncbi:MAG: hypothetical protein KC419_14055 [Anaerolineales bacterium]|nr:hypothetical protein [Anaerolineales bacterium]MCA9929604.1 hypothetical protein [Anaerolineales bacterium]
MLTTPLCRRATRPRPFLLAGEQAIAEMDAAQLAEIVGEALAEPMTVTDCQATLLGGLDSSPMAGGVYKVAGTAVTLINANCEWTVVVKILRPP